MGERMYSSEISRPRQLLEVIVKLQAMVVLPQGKDLPPQPPPDGRLGGPKIRCEQYDENIFYSTGIGTAIPVFQVAASRYTNCAIPYL
jgi:hypothetical protein